MKSVGGWFLGGGEVVKAALLTGCRYQELNRLVVADFDRTSKAIWVRPEQGKSKKGRWVHLNEDGVRFFMDPE